MKMDVVKTLLICVLGIVLLHKCSSSDVFLSAPSNVTLVEYDNITLKCKLAYAVAAGPFWLKDGTIIAVKRDNLNNPNYRVEGEELQFNLHIVNVTLPENEGKYSCQASTTSGTKEQEHYVTVNIPPSIQVIPNLDEVDLELKGEVNIRCRSTAGKPEPSIVWTKEGVTSQELTMEDDLIIDDAKKSDTGIYRCTGTNDVGSVHQEISINIRYPPTVKVSQSFIHAAPGQDIELECTFSASPAVTVQWQFNDSNVDIEKEDTISHDTTTSVLRLMDLKVEQMGDYQCKGTNDWGIEQGVITLSGTPLNLTIVSEEESKYVNQYILEWTVVSLPPLTEFVILVQQGEGESSIQWEEIIPAKNSDSKDGMHHQMFILNDLEKNSTYHVQMVAHNQVGSGEWADTFTFTTPADGEVAEPVNEENTTEPNEVSSGYRSSTHFVLLSVFLALCLLL